MEKEPLQWQAYEYVHREKSSDWFWAVGIISLSIAVVAILFKNILFAILIVVGTFTLCLFAARRPLRLYFEIDEKGITAGKIHYPYVSLESFWIEENFGQPKILLKSKRVLVPYIVLPIEAVDPGIVRDYLSAHLPLEEHQEPLLQKIMEYLGF